MALQPPERHTSPADLGQLTTCFFLANDSFQIMGVSGRLGVYGNAAAADAALPSEAPPKVVGLLSHTTREAFECAILAIT